MALVPIPARPIIRKEDEYNGFVTRYFVRHTSVRNYIVEINKEQYDVFKNARGHIVIDLPWAINGYSNTVYGANNVKFIGAKQKNLKVVELYDAKMPGLKRILLDPLEYFRGKVTSEVSTSAAVISSTTYNNQEGGTIETTTTTTFAPTISIAPSSLVFAYTIGGASPQSQSLSVTSNVLVSGLTVVTGSSWVSASLTSTTTPATINITPIGLGLASGSYTSTVTVSGTGVSSVSSSVAISVVYSSSVLFAYEPGLSLSSATFSRSGIATYNEVI